MRNVPFTRKSIDTHKFVLPNYRYFLDFITLFFCLDMHVADLLER